MTNFISKEEFLTRAEQTQYTNKLGKRKTFTKNCLFAGGCETVESVNRWILNPAKKAKVEVLFEDNESQANFAPSIKIVGDPKNILDYLSKTSPPDEIHYDKNISNECVLWWD